MPTYVLGISCFFHDAAACLLRDGEIVHAVEEERFSRRKHDPSFPTRSIDHCLRAEGITAADLAAVGFYEDPQLKFSRIVASIVDAFPRSLDLYMRAIPLWLRERLHVERTIRDALGDFGGAIYFGEHHRSHAASAFFVSPFSDAAVITMDGIGEWASATYGIGSGTHLELTHEIRFPHSLGLLYSAFTAHLGFEVNEGEYKVMGLAPYGRPTYLDQVREVVDVKPDGSFQLDLRYFAYHYRTEIVSRAFADLFGPRRPIDGPVEPRHADIAASIQRITEDILINAARHLHEVSGLNRLVMAGGVALNCVANGRVLRETPMTELWIQPAAGDSGGSIGIATDVYHRILGRSRGAPMRHAYLGPSYDDDEIAAFLDANDVPYERLSEDQIVVRTARLLADENVIGWFRGPMEFGPRALGARSILASPIRTEMREIVNEKIKHREPFRPFAPAVLQEAAAAHFDLGTESPFMLIVAPVREEKRDVLGAVTHVDGSARVQTVASDQAPAFHALIRTFGELTGVPVLLNTSFNVRGEPIVNTPAEAYNTFCHTDMDALVMGNLFVARSGKKMLYPYPGRKVIRTSEAVM